MFEQITFLTPKLLVASFLAVAFAFFYGRMQLNAKIKIAVSLLIPVAIFLCCIILLSCNVPYSDDYPSIISYAAQDLPARLNGLLKFHFEHRIVMTRLVAELSIFLFGHIDFYFFIIVSNIMLMALLFLLYSQFKQNNAIILFVPFVWLLLDWFNWENPLWAMAGIENIGVLLFAFLAFDFATRKHSSTNLLTSMIFATAATLTSGQGLITWFCILGLFTREMICDKAKRMKLIPHLLLLIVGTAIAVGLYFRGFQRAAQTQGFSIINAIDFLVSYCGGVVPIHFVALPIGVFTIAILVWAAFAFHQPIDRTILAMAAFLFGNFFAGSIFRTEPIGFALCFRYTIVSTMFFGCCLFLVHQLTPNVPLAVKRKLVLTLCCGAVFINIASALLGYPIFAARKESLVKGIMDFAAGTAKSGLFIGPFDNAKAINDLSAVIKAGRYIPPGNQ